jgi:hypothetical protein
VARAIISANPNAFRAIAQEDDDIGRERAATMRNGFMVLLVVLLSATAVQAHVPYLEKKDFAYWTPFRPEMPHQSIAVYAWLESKDDIDYYSFKLERKTPFLAEVLVPVFPQYADFRPSFALIGKGLPGAPASLPVVPTKGYGALVLSDDATKPRKTFYEPFGGKSYYQGPRLERTLEPGQYALVYWDPLHRKGDYVAVIGRKEIWRAKDILRALRVTPLIRMGKELHLRETKAKATAKARAQPKAKARAHGSAK